MVENYRYKVGVVESLPAGRQGFQQLQQYWLVAQLERCTRLLTGGL